MKEKFDYDEFIEKYLDGKMTGDELKWFEKEMKDNPSLINRIEFLQELNDAIREDDVFELRDQLDAIHDEVTAPYAKRKAKENKGVLKLSFYAAVVQKVSCFQVFNPVFVCRDK